MYNNYTRNEGTLRNKRNIYRDGRATICGNLSFSMIVPQIKHNIIYIQTVFHCFHGPLYYGVLTTDRWIRILRGTSGQGIFLVRLLFARGALLLLVLVRFHVFR